MTYYLHSVTKQLTLYIVGVFAVRLRSLVQRFTFNPVVITHFLF